MCIRTIEELQEDTREKQIIDIRDKADFDKETYPGAVNIYWEELEEHMDKIRKDCPVYLLCYTGQKSEEIAQELNEQGYEVYSIKNGYRAWLKIKLSKMMADHNAAEQRTKDIERSIIKKCRSGGDLPRRSVSTSLCRTETRSQSVSQAARTPC